VNGLIRLLDNFSHVNLRKFAYSDKKQPLIPISKLPPVPIQTLPSFERLGSATMNSTQLCKVHR